MPETSATHPLNALPLGHMLHGGEYRVEQVLGVGGFGITYLATDGFGRPVAIKEYLPGQLAVRVGGATQVSARSGEDATDFDWGLRKFEEEGQRLAGFDHPHINRVLRLFRANGTAYLVLEYVQGRTLSQVLAQGGGQLATAPLQRLLLELLQALQTVHNAGLVHCDVKPANIMLRDADGSAVLLDFGASRQAVSQRTRSALSAYTPPYAAAEQYETASPDLGPWTDLYGLGMVAYRCISGCQESELPDAVTRSKWQRRGQGSLDLEPAVRVGQGRYPAALLEAVDWSLQPEEHSRPASAQAMLEAMGERLAPGVTPAAAPRPSPPPSPSSPPSPRAATPAPSPSPGTPLEDPSKKPRRWRAAVVTTLVVLFSALALLGIVAVDRSETTHPVALSVSPPGANVVVGAPDGDVVWQPGLRLPAGRYTAKASAPGHEPLAVSFDLPLQQPLALNMAVTRHRLTVTTTPPNATVRLPGLAAPFVSGQSLPAGDYEVEVSTPGFVTVKRPVALQRDETLSIALSRQQFRLRVDTEPADAVVRVVGQPSTFVSGANLPSGDHVVRVSAPGFRTVEQRVSLTEDRRIQIALQRQFHRLTVLTTPSGAAVTLLQPAANYFAGVSLPAGPVQVRVSAPRHRTDTRTITLNEDTTLNIRLESSCRTVTSTERQCSMVPVARQVPQQVTESSRISRSAVVTGEFGDSGPDVCLDAEFAAEDKVKDACNGSTSGLDATSGSFSMVGSRPIGFGVFAFQYRCSARASGVCQTTRTVMQTVTAQEQRCTDVPVQREVCE